MKIKAGHAYIIRSRADYDDFCRVAMKKRNLRWLNGDPIDEFDAIEVYHGEVVVLVRPCGKMLYLTCFVPMEIDDAFCERHPTSEWKAKKRKRAVNWDRGHTAWVVSILIMLILMTAVVVYGGNWQTIRPILVIDLVVGVILLMMSFIVTAMFGRKEYGEEDNDEKDDDERSEGEK